jgi:hypothetical protein
MTALKVGDKVWCGDPNRFQGVVERVERNYIEVAIQDILGHIVVAYSPEYVSHLIPEENQLS